MGEGVDNFRLFFSLLCYFLSTSAEGNKNRNKFYFVHFNALAMLLLSHDTQCSYILMLSLKLKLSKHVNLRSLHHHSRSPITPLKCQKIFTNLLTLPSSFTEHSPTKPTSSSSTAKTLMTEWLRSSQKNEWSSLFFLLASDCIIYAKEYVTEHECDMMRICIGE